MEKHQTKTHTSSGLIRKNSRVSLVEHKEPHTRYQSPHALAFPASLFIFRFHGLLWKWR